MSCNTYKIIIWALERAFRTRFFVKKTKRAQTNTTIPSARKLIKAVSKTKNNTYFTRLVLNHKKILGFVPNFPSLFSL